MKQINYVNTSIKNTPTDFKVYKEIIDELEEIKNSLHPENPKRKMFTVVKYLLSNFPYDTLKSFIVLDNNISISYDCARDNDKLGVFGVNINVTLDTNVFTILRSWSNNIKEQGIIDSNIDDYKKYIDANMNNIGDICLLKNWNYAYTKFFINNIQEINDDRFFLIDKLYKKIDNLYIQAFIKHNGEDVLTLKISPQSLERPASYLKIYKTNEFVDVIIYTPKGEEKKKSYAMNSGSVENLENVVEEIYHELKLSKSLLFSYNINSLNKNLFRTSKHDE